MPTTVNGGANLSLSFSYTPGSGFLAGQTLNLPEALRMLFRVTGTAADQIDGISAQTLVFSASTPQTIDLSALTDVLGNALTVARIRFIAIKVYWTTDNVPLLAGNAASNQFDGLCDTAAAKVKIYPSSPNNDGWVIFTAPQTTGMPVTGTTKALKLDPQTASGKVDLLIGTCSA